MREKEIGENVLSFKKYFLKYTNSYNVFGNISKRKEQFANGKSIGKIGDKANKVKYIIKSK